MKSERKIVSLIREISKENGYKFATFSYDWIKALEYKNTVMYIYGYNFPINSTSFTQIANDKSATYEILSSKNIPSVEHTYFMNPRDIHYVSYLGVDGNWKKMSALLDKYKKIIVKPNNGTGGTGLHIVENTQQLELAVHEVFSRESTLAISPYFEIEKEFRVIILDDEVKLVFSKERPCILGNGIDSVAVLAVKENKIVDNCIDKNYIPKKNEKSIVGWRHNLGNGSSPALLEAGLLYDDVTTLAKSAISTLGGRFASVDCVLIGSKLYVLEVNSGVMMDNFSILSKENYIKAKKIYKSAIETYFNEICGG